MANQHYNNLADEIARMQNEQNEAYVSASDSPSSSGQIIPPPQPAGSRNQHVNQANSVINEPRIDGYDEVFDPPVTQDYECPICMMVLRNPVQTPCGHRFCTACIHRHIA